MSEAALGQAEQIVRVIAQTSVDNEKYFCELDAVVGDDLNRLAGVLGHIQRGAVEQHRVPARFQTRGDPLPVGAMVQMQRHRHGNVIRACAPHAVQRPGADRLHGLDEV